MMANNPVLANWEQTNGTWNYKESGQNVTNTWKQVDGKWYYQFLNPQFFADW